MKKIGLLIRTNLYFFVPFFILVLIGMILNVVLDQRHLFFTINTPLLANLQDPFMFYYTLIGDGIFALTVCLAMGLIKRRYFFMGAASFLLQGLLVQIGKQVLFVHRQRPWAMFKEEHIHLVKDFIPYSNNSFPSGHTATAFALFALIAFLLPLKRFGILLFFLAFLVGYSRIYLAQHFFIDTYVGAILGVFSSVVAWLVFTNTEYSWTQKNWLDKPLITFRHERA